MKLNRTLLRAIEILELLGKNKDGYTLIEITTLLDAPKSSVFDILKTLVYTNMVEEDTSFNKIRYKIGLHAFLIGSNYVNDIDMIQVARQYLVPLANKMKATTFMAVMDDAMVTYIYKYESSESIITTAKIGTRRELHSAALGKAMLAFANEKTIREAIQKINFEPYTEYTITSIEKYMDELKEVRAKGYAKDDRENTVHQIAAAAPIFNHRGEVVASISCVGMYEETVNLDVLGEVVKKEAILISSALGYIE
ncbi:MAG: IclR family transcriptional regulator [Coprobacillaceae bacterium]